MTNTQLRHGNQLTTVPGPAIRRKPQPISRREGERVEDTVCMCTCMCQTIGEGDVHMGCKAEVCRMDGCHGGYTVSC